MHNEKIVYDRYKKYQITQFPDYYYCTTLNQLEDTLTFLLNNQYNLSNYNEKEDNDLFNLYKDEIEPYDDNNIEYSYYQYDSYDLDK